MTATASPPPCARSARYRVIPMSSKMRNPVNTRMSSPFVARSARIASQRRTRSKGPLHRCTVICAPPPSVSAPGARVMPSICVVGTVTGVLVTTPSMEHVGFTGRM